MVSVAEVAAVSGVSRKLSASIIRIEESQEGGKTFKVYVVQCSKLGTIVCTVSAMYAHLLLLPAGRTWEVKRRYRMFHSFYTKVNARLAKDESCAYDFPQKTLMLRALTAADLEARRKKLDHFLRITTASTSEGVPTMCGVFLDVDSSEAKAEEEFGGSQSETDMDSDGGSPNNGLKSASEMYVSPSSDGNASDNESFHSRSNLLNSPAMSTGTISMPSSPAMQDHIMREKMMAFYLEHNPDKIDKVDKLMDKYKHSLDDMFEALHKKYGIEMPADGDMDISHQAGELELSREIEQLMEEADAANEPQMVGVCLCTLSLPYTPMHSLSPMHSLLTLDAPPCPGNDSGPESKGHHSLLVRLLPQLHGHIQDRTRGWGVDAGQRHQVGGSQRHSLPREQAARSLRRQ
jgi:hypothetical protein